tara:strand:+ start:1170 stop:1709 length:540 start_codon:yes stop_codon:yes gene_type:complete
MLNNLKAELQAMGKYVVQQARSNLTKGKENASKDLYNSIKYKEINNSNGYSIEWIMDKYGVYVDKGVKGTKSNYVQNSESPFSYKSKGGKFGLKGMPPPSAFDKWSIRRGIAPRNKKGKFESRKTLNFLIARSVFEKGIKASFFFTKAFDNALKRYQPLLLEAMVEDIIELTKQENGKN